jgi:hypothetical protein
MMKQAGIGEGSVTISEVLDDFGISHRKGRCACPIHGGDNPTAFSFNDEIFYCHTQGCKGNVFTLVRALLNSDSQKATEYLFTRFGVKQEYHQTAPNKSNAHENIPIDPRLASLRSNYACVKEQIQIFTTTFKELNDRFRRGEIDLSTFYLKQQILDQTLEELGSEEAFLNYEIKLVKKMVGDQRRKSVDW